MKSKLVPVLVNSVLLLSVIGLSSIIAPAHIIIQGADAIDVDPVVEAPIHNTLVAGVSIVIDQIHRADETIIADDVVESAEIESIQANIVEDWEVSAADVNDRIAAPIIDIEKTPVDIDLVFSPVEDYIETTASTNRAILRTIRG